MAMGMKVKVSKILLPFIRDFTTIQAITEVSNIVKVAVDNIRKMLLRKDLKVVGKLKTKR
jgi:hypothetical protein